MDDYIPDGFDLPDALAPHPPRPAASRPPVPAPVVVRPPTPPLAPPVQWLAPNGPDDPFDDIGEWDEDALIAAAEAEAAENQLQQIREYERQRPPQPVVVERPFAPPARAAGSPSKCDTSQARAGSSWTRHVATAPRFTRPVSPPKPLFPPFTASTSKRPAAGSSIFPSSSHSGPSTSSQKPTSQLESVLITSSPEAERPALPKSTAPRKKAVPVKRAAPVTPAPTAPAAGRRVKGRPKAEVEVIEID